MILILALILTAAFAGAAEYIGGALRWAAHGMDRVQDWLDEPVTNE